MAVQFPGMADETLIYEGGQALVYRARRQVDGVSVILKALKGPYPSAEAVRQFRREAEITQRVVGEGVIGLHKAWIDEAAPYLVLEDFGAVSLAHSLAQGPLSDKEVLSLAIKIVAALDRVHQLLVVHKDINPANIVWNPETGEVKLIDFGISSLVSREHPALSNPEVLQGTLPYISPEQTGRMNRSVDSRSDLYSLGVTLYEMLVGRLPFIENEPLALVHAHVARVPPAPIDIRPSLHPDIAAVLCKLLAKTADERYQSGFGLGQDLAHCLAILSHEAGNAPFVPGLYDRPSRVQLPGQLYGRAPQIKSLVEAYFRTVDGAKEVVLLSGYSGVGKTSLVNEVHRPMVGTGGLFVSGKFDQFRRGLPYASLSSAFGEFVRGLLMGSEQSIVRWRNKLHALLGQNGQVLLDVIPELELLLGPQEPAPQVDPLETEQRLHLLFQRFVGLLAQPEHPLVLFVDDLQWADLATIRLFSLLARSSEVSHLLIIGAWRDNEVDSTHPLAHALTQLRMAAIPIQELRLQPLALADVHQYLQDALHTESEALLPLALRCHTKTNGNPFFLIQFVRSLEDHGLLLFVRETGSWKWDLAAIEGLVSTDNVVDLMTTNIRRLPEESQRVLCMAAVLGASFQLDVLLQLAQLPPLSLREALRQSREEGLLLLRSEELSIEEWGDIRHLDGKELAFVHDRVQQAAYQLLSESECQTFHLRVGRLLESQHQPIEEHEALFDVVQHLNAAIPQLLADERKDLARLNIAAGRRARGASAYTVALALLSTAQTLLDEGDAEDSLLFALDMEMATTSYLAQEYARTNECVERLLAGQDAPIPKARALMVRMAAQIAQDLSMPAIKTGLEALALLGIELPANPELEAVVAAMTATGALLTDTDLEALPHAPLLQDERLQVCMEILVALAPPAYLVSPLLMALISTSIVEISIQEGLASASPYGFALYGLMRCDAGALDVGFAMGQLSMRLLLPFPEAKQIKVRTTHVHLGFCRHWKEPLSGYLDEYSALAEDAIDIGDFEYASFIMMLSGMLHFHRGTPLAQLEPLLDRYTKAMRSLRQDAGLGLHGIMHQMVRNLMDQADDILVLQGEAYDEPTMLAMFRDLAHPTGLFVLHCFKTIMAFVLGEYALARRWGEEAQKNAAAGATATFHLPVFFTLWSLLLLWEHESTGSQETLTMAQESRARVTAWSAANPESLAQKALLLDAEFARVAGQTGEALEAYEVALQRAQENGFLMDEAITCELAGRFFRSRGNKIAAQAFLLEARYAYQRWGATAVVKGFRDRYPQLPHGSRTSTPHNVNQTFSTGTDLDVAAVLRSSQAISQEIELSRLVRLLLKLALESSGARKAMMLLAQGEEFAIVAEGSVEPVLAIEVYDPIQATDITDRLPQGVLHYVRRTGREVLLTNACEEKAFAQDPYISRYQVLSLLALPVIHKGKLNAILYLENDQTEGVFNADRVALANVLLAQAAISLENTRLFSELEGKVKERTQALQEALDLLEVRHQQQKETQGQLVQSEKMASLGTLVAGIAHEINNPISFTYNGANNTKARVDKLETLLKELTGDDATVWELFDEHLTPMKQNLEAIVDGCKRMQTIVSGLRSFSRLDEAEQKKSRVEEGLASTLALIKANYKDRVQFACDFQANIKIECWPAQLNQVFMNIMVNACQAIVAKQREPHEAFEGVLTLRTYLEDGQLKIAFEDNGIGMSQEVIDKAFEPFFTTKSVGDGTGLGLSISYGIIEKHDGTITIDSQEGEGTTFTLSLPAQNHSHQGSAANSQSPPKEPASSLPGTEQLELALSAELVIKEDGEDEGDQA